MPWSETSTMDQKRVFIKDYIRLAARGESH